MSTSTMPNDAPFVDVSSDAPFNAIENGITLAHAIFDTVRDPLLVLDQDLRIVAASRSFCQTFQLVRQDVRGHLLYEIDGGQWNIPELRSLLEAIVKDDTVVHNVASEFPRVGRRIGMRARCSMRRALITRRCWHSRIFTHRRAIEQQVQELLCEKDMLLEEMQHRVANSLHHRQHSSDKGANRPVRGDAIAIRGCAQARSVGCRRSTAPASVRSLRAHRDFQLSRKCLGRNVPVLIEFEVMAWLCTATALVVAMIVMARALHHFSELGGTGPVQVATQAVGVCAIVVTALSLAILSVPNG